MVALRPLIHPPPFDSQDKNRAEIGALGGDTGGVQATNETDSGIPPLKSSLLYCQHLTQRFASS